MRLFKHPLNALCFAKEPRPASTMLAGKAESAAAVRNSDHNSKSK